MKKIILFVIISIVVSLTTADNVSIQPEPPALINISTVKPSTSTTIAPTTKLTTTIPTTKPSTTTTIPTTTTTIPTTTTPATTEAPKTTPKPTPPPKLEVGDWSANYTDSNQTCIVLKMALKINLSQTLNDNKIENATLILPKNAISTADCILNKTIQSITLTWKINENVSDSITFTFEKNDTTKKYTLKSIGANLIPENIHFPWVQNPNITYAFNHSKTDELSTPLKTSYRCKPEEKFEFTDINTNVTGSFVITNFQMEPFYDAEGKSFDTARDCEAAGTPGIVPIAVGCSLAALIIIVLIAYLIGRRRSQARGYLSM